MAERNLNNKSAGEGEIISGIQPLASDPNMRRIRVGGKIAATLRAADIEALGLETGQRWTATLAQRVEETVSRNKARKQAMSLLSSRGYSRAELVERLSRRGHDANLAQAVADELQRDGWLNERAYAEDVVRSAVRRGPAGRRLLEEKLQRRSVAEDVASEVAGRAIAGQDDRQAAMRLARKRLGTMGGVEPARARRRLAGALARRGFDEEIVTGVLDALEKEGTLPPEAD